MNKWEIIFLELGRLRERDPQLQLQHTFQKHPFQSSLAEMVRETRQLCEEYDAEIGYSVTQWRTGVDFQPISPHAEMWRSFRIQSAHSFVDNFRSLHAGLTDPIFSEEEVIKWLLTDWWKEHGVRWCCMLVKANWVE